MPKQRSVDLDIVAFCGWDFLIDLLEACESSGFGGGDPPEFMQGLLSGLFGTGGRISEVLALRTWMVDPYLCDKVVVIKQMPLLKRFEKVGDVKKWKCVGHCSRRWNRKPTPQEYKEHKIKEYTGWTTKPIMDHRTFPIRVDEPATPYFIDWWKRKVKAKEEVLFPINRSAAFVRVRNVGKRLDKDIPFCNIRSSLIYDHWFRAERACQLAFDYGFDKDDMNEFFQWKERKPSMAVKYASLGWKGLAKKMDVDV